MIDRSQVYVSLRSTKAVSSVVAAALLVVACGSRTGTESSSVTGGSAAAPGSAPDSVAIEAELGFGSREYGLTDAQWTSTVELVQTEIASCMANAGFEYIPADVATVELAMSAVRTDPGVSRQEYKQRWGYGATTRFDNLSKEIELGERNLAVYDSLTEFDRVAYDRTLYGDDADASFAFQFDEEDFEPTGGCTRAAIESSFDPVMLDPDFVNPKDILVDSDGRVAAADLAWNDCMGAAGYDYEDQDVAIEEFGDRLDELLDGDDVESLGPAKLARLEELRAEEIVISLVDLECQILHVDDVIRQVELELFGKVISVN